MMAVVREFVSAAKSGPRLYFTPLLGAFEAIRFEIVKAEKKQALRRGVKHPVHVQKQKADIKRI